MTIQPHDTTQPEPLHEEGTLTPHQQAPAGADNPLITWALAARQAHAIAESLARTSFVPRSLQGRPADITAAILTGQELGMQPMAALRSLDIIQGTPSLRAHAMRALVQRAGHQIQLVESTPELCRMRGRRKGDEEWQTVVWTIERAQKLGLTSKEQWKRQPQSMLVARATSEICRLIASDVLFAVPYSTEELQDKPVEEAPPRVTVEEIHARGQQAAPHEEQPDEFEPSEEAQVDWADQQWGEADGTESSTA